MAGALGRDESTDMLLERLRRVMGAFGHSDDSTTATTADGVAGMVVQRALSDSIRQMEAMQRLMSGAAPDLSGTLDAKLLEAVRRQLTMAAGESMGLFSDKDTRVSSRLPSRLVEEAMARTGIENMTELIEYALTRVATEDDFGERLLRREGSVGKDINLEF